MIKPLFNQILIKPIVHETLLIAEKKTLCEYGEVLDIGPDCKQIKVGDKVAFTLWGLNAVDIEGTMHYFVLEHPDFILGKIDGTLEKQPVQESVAS